MWSSVFDNFVYFTVSEGLSQYSGISKEYFRQHVQNVIQNFSMIEKVSA